MSDVFVQSFTHLKDMPRAASALEMLKKVASLVKPIMRKHRWVLPVLSEFFPENQNLLGLNVNGGEKILVRLRYAGSPDTFLPLEDVVGTMLHELTHNVHGPHDDKFYKYLSGLQDEYDDLQRSGYAGEGFYSNGKRLGSDVSHNAPMHIGRLKALEAAEKRRKTSLVLAGGGQRLGGASGRTLGLSPKELAARAAEQRLKDENTCASGTTGMREAEKAANGSVESKVIDLTNEDDETTLSSSYRRPSTSNSGPSTSNAASREWTCSQCTLLNQPTSRQCVLCEAPMPSRKTPVRQVKAPVTSKANPLVKERLSRVQITPDEPWICSACTLSNPHDFWSCAACETIKVRS